MPNYISVGEWIPLHDDPALAASQVIAIQAVPTQPNQLEVQVEAAAAIAPLGSQDEVPLSPAVEEVLPDA